MNNPPHSAHPTPTLGEKLKHSRQLSVEQDTNYLREQARTKGDEDYSRFVLVESFFACSRKTLTDLINSGVVKPEILIGSKGLGQCKKVESLLRGNSFNVELDAFLSKTSHPYFCLARDFRDWATTQNLKVSFQPRHDGGGVDSWHALVADPL